MPTVGRRWPKKARGDYAAHCDYCGVRWRRGQMVRDAAGRLACPDDRRGRDEVTLSQLNAQGATEFGHKRYFNDGGSYFRTNADEETPLRTTLEDI